MSFGERRQWGAADVVLYLVGVAGLAASLTIVFLGMRAVLDVGGYCAEGGPYVIAQHCPNGVALLLPLSIFAGLGSAALMGWKGSVLGGPYAGLVLLAWPALFISLGWNFLEYAFWPPAPDTGIELGWLIPGVIFVIMGAVPLAAFVPGRGSVATGRQSGTTLVVNDALADGEARYSAQLRRARGRLLSDLVERAEKQAWGAGSSADAGVSMPEVETDLVSKLERLDALHRSGALSYDEFQRAKQAMIDAAAG